MDGPNIRTGEVKAFKLFALRSKLPHELRTSFKRYIHPLRVTIPTLLDFSNWLEYKLQVQDDGSRMTGLPPEPSSRRRQDRRDTRALKKPTSILLGTEKPITGCEIQAPAPEVTTKSARFKGRLRAYYPYCDNSNHFLNGCANFKELTKEQKECWIRKNNQCWCCGRSHHASKCNLESLCKMYHRKHLLILHDVNERTVADETETDTRENSCLVNTTKDILYVDRPVYSRNAGSPKAAQQLNLKGQPEDLILRTVRQDQQVLHGAAVSFTVSPVTNRHKKFPIQGAFTAERPGLAEQTHPVASLQKMYKHLAGLPLQQIERAELYKALYTRSSVGSALTNASSLPYFPMLICLPIWTIFVLLHDVQIQYSIWTSDYDVPWT
ncbi:3-oxoacyl-[acyl-carrier-protein] reductase [Labeo rohita]|uniref:3-oxoacyl-[acyl-carrier-protein] reductase n=1 Tax=Labeo rohita TaxID=84645 RepID=A0ABQ8M1I1_LABRO|nr:3-oxoacyl-[acyl-carrier-protein] reductase [Labeo rohita]